MRGFKTDEELESNLLAIVVAMHDPEQIESLNAIRDEILMMERKVVEVGGRKGNVNVYKKKKETLEKRAKVCV